MERKKSLPLAVLEREAGIEAPGNVLGSLEAPCKIRASLIDGSDHCLASSRMHHLLDS